MSLFCNALIMTVNTNVNLVNEFPLLVALQLMKDIVLVFRILNVCADNIESVPAYEEPISSLLQLCRLPYLKEKTSDEIAYHQMAIECTEQLGWSMLNLFVVDNVWQINDRL